MLFWGKDATPEQKQGESLDYQWRYSSAKAAKAGHAKMVEHVRQHGLAGLDELKVGV